MGHVTFLILHFGAFLFFIPALIVTLPLHLLWSSSKRRERLLRELSRRQT